MENHEKYSGYKLEILKKLTERTKNERKPYEDLILLNSSQYESLDKLRLQKSKLIASNDKLQNIIESGSANSGNKNLLKRIRKQNREYAQALDEKDKELEVKKKENQQLQASLTATEELLKRVQDKLANKENQLQLIQEEHASLQSTFQSMVEKMQNLEKATSAMQLEADTNQMTSENELYISEKEAEFQKELKEVAGEFVEIDTNEINAASLSTTVPRKHRYKFIAHESEVYAVAWTHSGCKFATAGGDRQVKIWNFISGQVHLEGVGVESHSSISSVDFDPEETFILAASNDGASRIWSAKDMKIQHTLTGHSRKVMSAKFFGESNKVVSGSCDRTLKIWDIRRRLCIQSIFAGSSVNDVVTTYGYGTKIVSGHFDKKIRIWDIRTDSRANAEILLQGRISSLDVSPDGYSLLSSVRDDDCLQLVDVRMNKVVRTFGSDGFIIGSDFTRAKFSPDGQFCVCGSQEGGIYIWVVSTGILEKVLRTHSSTVIACAWSWCGEYLLSCDRNGNANLWCEDCS